MANETIGKEHYAAALNIFMRIYRDKALARIRKDFPEADLEYISLATGMVFGRIRERLEAGNISMDTVKSWFDEEMDAIGLPPINMNMRDIYAVANVGNLSGEGHIDDKGALVEIKNAVSLSFQDAIRHRRAAKDIKR